MELETTANYWIDFPGINPNPVLRFNPAGEMLFANSAVALLCSSLGCRSVSELLPVDHLEHIRRCSSSRGISTVRYRVKDRLFTWSYRPSRLNEMINLYGHEVTEYVGLAGDETRSMLPLAALNVLGLPVIALDTHLNVLLCSQPAGDIIAASESLAIVTGILSSPYPKAIAQLKSDIATGGENDLVLRLPYQSDGTELDFVSLPMRSADKPDNVAVAMFHLQVSNKHRDLSIEHELIRRYNLTKAEAGLTNCLARGLTLQESSVTLGIAITTARSQLRSVFRKTGTRRQTELLIKILPGVVGR